MDLHAKNLQKQKSLVSLAEMSRDTSISRFSVKRIPTDRKNTWFKSPENEPAQGRNKPCPCGSGRKYKHCHIGKVIVESPE